MFRDNLRLSEHLGYLSARFHKLKLLNINTILSYYKNDKNSFYQAFYQASDHLGTCSQKWTPPLHQTHPPSHPPPTHQPTNQLSKQKPFSKDFN